MKKLIFCLIVVMTSFCKDPNIEIEKKCAIVLENSKSISEQEQNNELQKNKKNKFEDNAFLASKIAVGSAMFVGLGASLFAIHEDSDSPENVNSSIENDNSKLYKKLFAIIGILYPLYRISSEGLKIFRNKNNTANSNTENHQTKKNIFLNIVPHIFFGAASIYSLYYSIGKLGMFKNFLEEKNHIKFIRGSLALGLTYSVLDNAENIFKLIRKLKA